MDEPLAALANLIRRRPPVSNLRACLTLGRIAAGVFVLAASGGCQSIAGPGASHPTYAAVGPFVESHDIAGVWWGGATPQLPVLIDGGAPPLTPEGLARYKQTASEAKAVAASETDLNDLRKCLSVGTPRIWSQPFPFEIVVAAKFITILYEHNHVWRLVYMDEKQATEDEADTSYMGHAVGRWDGDALVIDDALFNDKTVLDDSGLPHGEKLHVTERLRALDGGKRLEVLATIEDPDFYSKPWTARWTFTRRSDVLLTDYLCGLGEFRTRYSAPEPGHQDTTRRGNIAP